LQAGTADLPADTAPADLPAGTAPAGSNLSALPAAGSNLSALPAAATYQSLPEFPWNVIDF
jgi:hypothetical protein